MIYSFCSFVGAGIGFTSLPETGFKTVPVFEVDTAELFNSLSRVAGGAAVPLTCVGAVEVVLMVVALVPVLAAEGDRGDFARSKSFASANGFHCPVIRTAIF